MFTYKGKFKYQIIIIIFSFIVGFLAINPVLAETALDAGSTVQQIEENKVQLPKDGDTNITIPEQLPSDLTSGDQGKMEVKGFNFTGELLVEEMDLQKIVQGQVGEELTLNDLNNLALKVTQYLREQGYIIAYAYIPAQEIKNGIVIITIIPGKYGEIKIDNLASLSTERLERMTSLLQAGEVITEESLERTLLLINDLTGMESKSTLAPGKESGTTDLIITTSDTAKTNGTVTVDNWGNRFTGSTVYGTNLSFNNLSNMGDYLNIVLQTSGSDLKSISLGYNLPLSYQGLKMSLNYSKMNYALGEDFADLDASGESEIIAAELKYPFIRSREVNLYGITGYDRKDFIDDITSTDTHTARNSALWKIGFSGDFSNSLFAGGKTTYSLTYYRGDLKINDEVSAFIDASSAETAGGFSKTKIVSNHRQNLNSNLSLNLLLNGQYAAGNLDSSEKMSLGGANGIKAYPQGEASGDQGYLLTVELRKLLGWSTRKNSFYLTGFYDYGKVTINKDPWLGAGDNKRSLKDIGIGFIWAHSDKYILRLDYAHKLGNEEAASDTDQDNRLWLRLVRYF